MRAVRNLVINEHESIRPNIRRPSYSYVNGNWGQVTPIAQRLFASGQQLSRVRAVLEVLPFGSRGMGLTLTTDNGTQFTSARYVETLNRLGITHRRTAYNHPEGWKAVILHCLV